MASPDWPRVADDGTHHVIDGAPAYAARFDEVLKFHPPGLAPVMSGGWAWHIHPDGTPAYARRFRRTFGFYAGRAAVIGSAGWHHIYPDGIDLSPARYGWCGNYQDGRCAVRAVDGAYLHLDLDGAPAYAMRWSYAGDFRDGIGVVQRGDGRSTHIDRSGQALHGRWFVDLDVYHKGFARARDARGWMHIDRAGAPLYRRRFAAVEPFYNGQARVEQADGGLMVIDEAGQTLCVLRGGHPAPDAAPADTRPPLQPLSGDLVGFWRTRAIAAAVEVGVFEALPATAERIARATGLPQDSVRRLVRALGELELVSWAPEGSIEPFDGRWHPTARGELLRRDHPCSMADAAAEYGGPLLDAWRALPGALRQPEAHRPGIFRAVAADPARRASHHRMLRAYAIHDYTPLISALDLAGHVLDAGGGSGALAALVAEHAPAARVTLLDLPQIAGLAPSDAGFSARGVDLFEPWPVRGDVVLFARVLHDWDDADALRLLRRARAALEPGGRIIAFERLIDEAPGAVDGGLCDLHLLATTGGRSRGRRGFAALFGAAGLDLEVHEPLADGPAILMGRSHD